MDKIRKFELMEKIVHELEDLKNSNQALIQKIAKIEVDNIDLGNKRIEKDLPDMHQRIADNLDTIASILEDFANQTDEYSDKNNIAALKEQEEIEVIEMFLPKQLTPEELRERVQQIITESGAVSAAEMGKVIGLANKQLVGMADGKAISAVVKELLAK